MKLMVALAFPASFLGLLAGAPGALAGEPGEVLARVREAIGAPPWESGAMVSGAIRFSGTDSRFSIIFDREGRYVQEIDGPLPTRSGFDGERAWEQDWNGVLRTLHLGERHAGLFAGWLFSGLLFSERTPLDFTLSEEESNEETLSLGFTYRNGHAAGRVEIARDTGLPRLWSITVEPHTHTYELSDYARESGFATPRRVRSRSTAGIDNTTAVEAVGEAPVFIVSPFERPPGREVRAAFDATTPPRVEVKRAATGHLLVQPTVDGKDLGWFILDSGAGSNILSTTAVEAGAYEPFGSVPVGGAGGGTMGSFVKAGAVALGPATIRDPIFVVLDLRFLSRAFGVEVGGIIGYGFFGHTVVEVDMKAATLSIHNPETYALAAGEWMPLMLYQRVPNVVAAFDGGEGVFKLDTGAGGAAVIFNAPFTERSGILEGKRTSPTVLGGVGGMVRASAATIGWFELAGHRTENVRANFATQKIGAFADAYSAGVVGSVLMQTFTLVLDYPRERIAFIDREPEPAER